MLIEKIENSLKKLLTNIKKETFIFDFLEAYDLPKATISRLQKGDYNLSKNCNELIWKKKIAFTSIDKDKQDPHITIDELSKGELPTKYDLRFLIVTNFEEFLAIDLKSKQSLDIKINDLHKHVDFFLPLGGLEKSEILSENLADIKAAEKIGRLYDVILENNILLFKSEKHKHDLNIFLTRLLFCFFAEDSEIFLKDQFTNSIASHTLEDGSDLKEYFEKFFFILNTKDKKNYPKYLSDFPYVNGGLFSKEYKLPNFSKEIRKIIIQCGALDWSQINPDIFGSMLQAVVNKNNRQNLGIHYTSVTNIRKVIKPLFLDSLYEEFNNSISDEKKLKKLLQRIYNIIIFDPACGSGNFLIISFKELCKLEIEIYKKLQNIDKSNWGMASSGILLKQFFGIEIDDFAHEITKLSLWLAEHQMNISFKEVFGECKPSLPLTDNKNILCENALQVNWEDFCSTKSNKTKEMYILGNPPYLGSSLQSQDQKKDMEFVFKGKSNFKNLDYVSCWFCLGSQYISKNNGKLAFVTTKSICRGEQVDMLWPHIFKLNVQIDFAYKQFKWTNNARQKAGVIVAIIGLSRNNNNYKLLFEETTYKKVKNISPYLTNGSNLIIKKIPYSISKFQEMTQGNKAVDGGNLILSEDEKKILIKNHPIALKFIRKLIGAEEFISGKKRYCLWINDEDLKIATKIPSINQRIQKTRQLRLSSKKEATKKLAIRPHQFEDLKEAKKNLIIIPSTTSERREYIPIGIIDNTYIVTNSAHILIDAPLFLFSLISSHMHRVWVVTVSGYLGTGIRYSSTLSYNTFPFPDINKEKFFLLEKNALNILDQREKYSEMTIEELYDPDKMPLPLRDAHKELDLEIERCYREKPFVNDEERLEYLFTMYESMIDKNEGTLI
jgi:hypothetical protein